MSEEKDKPVVTPNPFFMTPGAYAFAVPAKQCLFTAALVGVTVGALPLLLSWFGAPIPAPWKIAATMAVLAFGITALYTWPRYRRQWMDIIEKITDKDLDNNGVIGPEPVQGPPQTVRIELIQDGGNKGDWIDLPASPDQLKRLAVGIVEKKKPFTVGVWVGGNESVFKRPEFDQLRAVLIERELIHWKNEDNPNNGVEWTRQGLAVMRYLASDNYQPTPLLS